MGNLCSIVATMWANSVVFGFTNTYLPRSIALVAPSLRNNTAFKAFAEHGVDQFGSYSVTESVLVVIASPCYRSAVMGDIAHLQVKGGRAGFEGGECYSVACEVFVCYAIRKAAGRNYIGFISGVGLETCKCIWILVNLKRIIRDVCRCKCWAVVHHPCLGSA